MGWLELIPGTGFVNKRAREQRLSFFFLFLQEKVELYYAPSFSVLRNDDQAITLVKPWTTV
jgi:hypothetical protein